MNVTLPNKPGTLHISAKLE